MKNMSERNEKTINSERDFRSTLRRVLREPQTIALGAVLIGFAALGTAKYAKDKHVFAGPTDEQEKGMELFISPDENGNFVHNLIVGSEGVNVRTKPHTETGSVDDNSVGVSVRKLDPGTVVEKALVVWGNDPKNPIDRKVKDYWYLFPDPKNPKTMIFANSGLFEFNPETYSVQPLDLKN
jgi:hypothetical protein